MPWSAVEFLAEQLGIEDASCVKKYVQRPQTPYEHAWEIRDRYGYRSTDDEAARGSRGSWTGGRGRTLRGRWRCSTRRSGGCGAIGCCCLASRCWPGRSPRPRGGRDAAVRRAGRRGATRRSRVPERLATCSRCRTGRGSRSWSGCAARHGALGTGDGQGPAAGGQIAAFGAGPGRGSTRSRQPAAGAGPHRARVARHRAGTAARAEADRDAASVVRHLEASAIDDALDLFALLMQVNLINVAKRATDKEYLAGGPARPRLAKASRTVRAAWRLWSEQLPWSPRSAPTSIRQQCGGRWRRRWGRAGRSRPPPPCWTSCWRKPARTRSSAIEIQPNGRAKLNVDRLGALGESEVAEVAAADLRAMLPRIDLPDLLFEVHSWTGFLDAFVHLGDGRTRMQTCRPRWWRCWSPRRATSATPGDRRRDEALTRARLSTSTSTTCGPTPSPRRTRPDRGPGRGADRRALGRGAARLGRRAAVRRADADHQRRPLAEVLRLQDAASPGSTPSTTRWWASGRWSCPAPRATRCTSWTPCST